jgi:hypothetical protein
VRGCLGHPPFVRYIDSGRRDPDQALGSWLGEATQDPSVVALRWQSGFFGVAGLGHLAPLMSSLKNMGHVVRLLIGSNDGVTPREDIEVLLNIVGEPRQGLDVGVVSFGNGYFHPKTIHLTRDDGSMTAYVGSANLTINGVSALHVEAGIILETRDGDDPAVLRDIVDAVDCWFTESRSGLFRITGPADLDSLVENKILSVPRPRSARWATAGGGQGGPRLPDLTPLIHVPPITLVSGDDQTTTRPPEGGEDSGAVTPTPVEVEAEWSKNLTASDAQRKAVGHQRGSITLTQNRYPINAQTYFREDFFGAVSWFEEVTRTGQTVESAHVRMLVSINDVNIGEQDIHITHGTSRESGQGNYTTLIHLGPLALYFSSEDMTGRRITIQRRNDGSYSLTIS